MGIFRESGPAAFLPTDDTLGRSRISATERDVLELFELFRSPLLRYALSFGLRLHDAEEVVQEVFLALFQHLTQGKARTNLRGWIFRVTHNLSIKSRAQLNVRERAHCAESNADQEPDRRFDPEEDFVLAERQRRLMAVISVLPEQDRCCLYLRAEGLKYREISSVLGMSLGAVSISLGRTLGRLANAGK